MIKYSLACADGHEFVSWFRSSADYDEQTRRGLVDCPVCRSTQVSKAVMAPNVARRDLPGRPKAAGQAAHEDGETHPVALLDESHAQLRAALRDLRSRILESSTDVGDQFADQARRMHEGELPARPIRGVTTPAEARDLLETGVPIMPIPTLPDERN